MSREGRAGVAMLESEDLAVGVRLGQGARVVELTNRRDGRQWLRRAREPGEPRAADEGLRFTDTDHHGWDEMFPTVDPCVYPCAPFAGACAPDHGELWRTPFATLARSESSLRQRATSPRFHYEFERALSVEGPTLRAEYSVVVTADVAAPMLWALHPQFEAGEGTRVVLAGHRDCLLDTSSPEGPRAIPWTGELVVERDVEPGADRMLYARPGDDVGEVALVDPSGSWLRVTWDTRFAPYLGLWLDRGRFTTGRVVAIEPTNGFFDELARAVGNGRIGWFAPGARVSWWVEVTLGQGGM